jgi:hypothetical protein
METKMTFDARKILTGAIAATSLAAMVAASSTPAAAWGYRHGGWGGPGIAAGIIGGIAAGALIAGAARPAYAVPAPVYVGPNDYYEDGPVCHQTWQPMYREGVYVGDRAVRVCD